MKKMHFLGLAILSFSIALLSFSGDHFAGTEQDLNKEQTHIKGSKVVFTQVVHLEGSNEIPAVETDAKGIAILRMTEDRMLYSKVIVNNSDPMEDGMLTAAHIHFGDATSTGGVMLFLVHEPSEFGMNTVRQVSMEQYNAILNNPLYVNAHSTLHPSGLVRGQIR